MKCIALIKYLNEIKPKNTLQQIPIFLDSKALISVIDDVTLKLLKVIKYYDNGKEKQGFKAELLPKLCALYLKARRENILDRQQIHLAAKSEILQEAFSEVGIIALVHEATGYQYDRKHNALRILLEHYIEEEARKWIKEFPNEFFYQLDKLYSNPKTISRNRPIYYGNFINKYVYLSLERGVVLNELNNINPNIKTEKSTYRKNRHHQHLTEKIGIQQFRIQVGKVLGIMELSKDINDFKINFEKTHGQLSILN